MCDVESFLNRQYFTKPGYLGRTVLQQFNLDIKEKLRSDIEIFKEIQNQWNTYYGYRTPLMQYKAYEIGQKAFVKLQEKEIARDTLIERFHAGVLTGIYRLVRDFEQAHCMDARALDVISKSQKTLESNVALFNAQLYSKLEFVHPVRTLKKYTQSHPLVAGDRVLTNEYLRGCTLAAVVNAIYDVIIYLNHPKQGGVLLYGQPSTRKTTITNMLAEILMLTSMSRHRHTLNNYQGMLSMLSSY